MQFKRLIKFFLLSIIFSLNTYAEESMFKEVKKDIRYFTLDEVNNLIISNKHGNVYFKNSEDNKIIVELVYSVNDINAVDVNKDLKVNIKREKSTNYLDLRIEDKIKSKYDKIVKFNIYIYAPSSITIFTEVTNGIIEGDKISFKDVLLYSSNSKINMKGVLLNTKSRFDIKAQDKSDVILEITRNSAPFRMSIDDEDIKSTKIEFPFTEKSLSKNETHLLCYNTTPENADNALSRIDLEDSTLIVK